MKNPNEKEDSTEYYKTLIKNNSRNSLVPIHIGDEELLYSSSNIYQSLLSDSFTKDSCNSKNISEKFTKNSVFGATEPNTLTGNTSKWYPSPEEIDSLLKGYVQVRYKRKIELVDDFKDDYPLLELRKCLLRISHSISELCLRIVKSKIFETIVVLVIIMNTIVLGIEDPNNIDSTFYAIELFFVYFYTVECLFKVYAYGFIWNKGSYIRDPWNILDFTIVITAWISTYGNSSVQISVLRTFRILRPLRSLSSVKGIRALVMTLFRASKQLFSALVIFYFFILIFAIVGLQLFSGLLNNQCMAIDTGYYYAIDNSCGDYPCPFGYVCVDSLDNELNGSTNFDNILISFVIVFQILTLEGWTPIMEWVERSFNYSAICYFLPLVFIGANLMLNLTRAIITISFNKISEEQRTIKPNSESLDFLEDSDEENNQETDSLSKSMNQDIDSSSKNAESLEFVPEIRNKNLEKLKNYEIKPIFKAYQQVRRDESIDLNNSGVYAASVIENVPRLDSINSFEESSPKKLTKEECSNQIAPRITENFGLHRKVTSHIDSYYSQSIKTDLSRNTLRRIKTVLTLKHDFFSINNIKRDKSIGSLINEFYVITSESIPDIKPSTLSTHLNLFDSFTYEISIPNNNLKYYYEKYSECTVVGLKSKLVNLFGIQKAFFIINPSAKKQIVEVSEKDRINRSIIGSWSGCDVADFCNFPLAPLNSMHFKMWSRGWLGSYERFSYVIRKIILHKYTINLVTFTIVFNTACLAGDHYGISQSDSNLLSSMNEVFTYFFAVELVLRIIGLGISDFVRDKMNYYDTIVVLLSLVEIFILASSTSALSAFRVIRIFRIFRVMRVVRLLRYLRSLSIILKAISSSLANIGYLFLLIAFLLAIFSLLGMKIFQNKFNFPQGIPRQNYDTFQWALLTTFQVLTTENWNTILVSSLNSQAGPASCLYLITWVVIGNHIFLELFLAILIESIGESNNSEDNGETLPEIHIIRGGNQKLLKKLKGLDEIASDSESVEDFPKSPFKENIQTSLFESNECEYSYFIFSKENKLRIFVIKLITNQKFDFFILFVIICNSIKLVWDTYIINDSNNSSQKVISSDFDLFFTVFFTLEFLLKSIGLGLILDKGTYLRSGWNRLDFFIVIFSLIDASVSSINLPIIKVFRLLRTLRPLRLISHNPSMKIVVTALIESLKAIMNVVIVIVIIWLVFAILAVSLLSGKRYSCSNPSLLTQISCIQSGYQWINGDSNYDNVIEAFVTLFIVMSQESWPDRMVEGIDAVGVGVAPIANYNIPMGYYYIVYFTISNFIMLNLFTAVVFNKFSEAKRNESSISELILTHEQMLWKELQKFILKSKPEYESDGCPENRFRAFLYRVTRSKKFEIFMMIAIICNMLVMTLPYKQASAAYLTTIEYINAGFTYIFIVEAAAKITAEGFKMYFSNNLNKFDFFVAFMSGIDLIFEYAIGFQTRVIRSVPQIIRILRVFRVGRLLRLVRLFKALQDLVLIMKVAFPIIMNILSIMLLIFFIYAILGSFLFSSVSNGYYIIDDYYNFHNFGYSMVILWRMSTGEDYPYIMWDCIRQLGSKIYYIYFISFVAIIDFIFLDLFVSVVIQNYEDFTQNSDSSLNIFNREIKIFRKFWNMHTVSSAGKRISKEKIFEFLQDFGPVFGVCDKNPSRIETIKLIGSLNMKNISDYYYFHDVFFGLMKRKYGRKVYINKGKYSCKILRLEEINSMKKLDLLRYKALEYFSENVENNNENAFLKFMYMKNIFVRWKKYSTRNKNEGSVSITPRFSEYEYPGENSFNSSE